MYHIYGSWKTTVLFLIGILLTELFSCKVNVAPDESKTAEYKVEHYQQNIDINEYTLVETDTEKLSGNIGELTKAVAKTYEGFELVPFDQTGIVKDGSTVVKIKYNRKLITLTFDLNGGAPTTTLTPREEPYFIKISDEKPNLPTIKTALNNYSSLKFQLDISDCSELKKIEMAAFNKCSGLTSIIIPASVTSIGDNAFDKCDNLTQINYTGTQTQWDAITVGSGNSPLSTATITYNYVPPII